ncbi:hypothetical protein SASPL_155656 [Salvia splendens]|uniref:Pectin acetylesterase n=1 Tax=Salvia splendens TaxID=180675 RepID=A0A8X8YX24_SALSN|nr:hypothetical protein SASPL_155656 [Salvia splendens]
MERGIITMAGWLSLFIWSVLVMNAQVDGDQLIDITFLKSAIPKGADFYNWHKVYIYYCDGSSFMSDIKHVDPRTKVTYRGARIFKVVMEELLSKGMGNAKNAIKGLLGDHYREKYYADIIRKHTI